jgi:hypothetical protein
MSSYSRFPQFNTDIAANITITSKSIHHHDVHSSSSPPFNSSSSHASLSKLYGPYRSRSSNSHPKQPQQLSNKLIHSKSKPILQPINKSCPPPQQQLSAHTDMNISPRTLVSATGMKLSRDYSSFTSSSSPADLSTSRCSSESPQQLSYNYLSINLSSSPDSLSQSRRNLKISTENHENSSSIAILSSENQEIHHHRLHYDHNNDVDNDRNSLLSFFQSPECHLFSLASSCIPVYNADIDYLLRDSTAQQVLAILNQLNNSNARFNSFQPLRKSVRQLVKQRIVLSALAYPNSQFFIHSNQSIIITEDQLQQLCSFTNLERTLRIINKLNAQKCRYNNLAELLIAVAAAIRAYNESKKSNKN